MTPLKRDTWIQGVNKVVELISTLDQSSSANVKVNQGCQSNVSAYWQHMYFWTIYRNTYKKKSMDTVRKQCHDESYYLMPWILYRTVDTTAFTPNKGWNYAIESDWITQHKCETNHQTGTRYQCLKHFTLPWYHGYLVFRSVTKNSIAQTCRRMVPSLFPIVWNLYCILGHRSLIRCSMFTMTHITTSSIELAYICVTRMPLYIYIQPCYAILYVKSRACNQFRLNGRSFTYSAPFFGHCLGVFSMIGWNDEWNQFAFCR